MIYVDDAELPYGRMIMCHMITDQTRGELFRMVDLIGIPRKHIQAEGTWREHFDISKVKKKLAIQNGAVEVTQRELINILRSKVGFKPTK